jgi:hypothetical protein
LCVSVMRTVSVSKNSSSNKFFSQALRSVPVQLTGTFFLILTKAVSFRHRNQILFAVPR